MQIIFWLGDWVWDSQNTCNTHLTPKLKQQNHTQEEQKVINLRALSEKRCCHRRKKKKGRKEKKIHTISRTQHKSPSIPIPI